MCHYSMSERLVSLTKPQVGTPWTLRFTVCPVGNQLLLQIVIPHKQLSPRAVPQLCYSYRKMSKGLTQPLTSYFCDSLKSPYFCRFYPKSSYSLSQWFLKGTREGLSSSQTGKYSNVFLIPKPLMVLNSRHNIATKKGYFFTINNKRFVKYKTSILTVTFKHPKVP